MEEHKKGQGGKKEYSNATMMQSLNVIDEPTGKDVVVLVDGSSSICLSDFQTAKNIAKAIVCRFVEDGQNQIGLVQFSLQAEVHCYLTDKHKVCYDAIESMHQMNRNTLIENGLIAARSCFSLSTKSRNEKQLWIITDGVYTEQPQETYNLKRKGVEIITIGIGEMNKDALDETASFNRSFRVSTFSSALELVLKDETYLPAYGIQIRSVTMMPCRFGDDICLNVTLENIGMHDIPDNSLLVVNKTPYTNRYLYTFDSLLRKGETKEISLRLISLLSTDDRLGAIEKIPSNITFELSVDGKPASIERRMWALHWGLFRKEFDSCGSPVNVLLFGHQGSGKSSLVNTLYSTFSQRPRSIAYVARHASGVTKSFDRFTLETGIKELPINFYDLPGFEQDKLYAGQEIEMMMQGVMPLHTQLVAEDGSPLKSDIHDLPSRNNVEEFKRRIHVVVMVTSLANAANDQQMERMAKFYERIRKNQRDVILVATHIDEFPDHTEQREMLETLKEGTRFETVFPLRNYVASDRIKDFEIERNVMRIVATCLNKAEDFLQRERDGLIRDQLRIHTDDVVKVDEGFENVDRLDEDRHDHGNLMIVMDE